MTFDFRYSDFSYVSLTCTHTTEHEVVDVDYPTFVSFLSLFFVYFNRYSFYTSSIMSSDSVTTVIKKFYDDYRITTPIRLKVTTATYYMDLRSKIGKILKSHIPLNSVLILIYNNTRLSQLPFLEHCIFLLTPFLHRNITTSRYYTRMSQIRTVIF